MINNSQRDQKGNQIKTIQDSQLQFNNTLQSQQNRNKIILIAKYVLKFIKQIIQKIINTVKLRHIAIFLNFILLLALFITNNKKIQKLTIELKIARDQIKQISNTVYWNKTKVYHPRPSWPGNNATQFFYRRIHGPRQFLAQTAYQIPVYVDPKDRHISEIILTTGKYIPQQLILIGQLVPRSGVFVNVGTHIALESIIMAKYMEPDTKFYLIEPNPINVKLLKKTLQLHGLEKQFTIYNMGASNKKYKSKLHVFYDNTGASRVDNSPTKIDEYIDIQLDTVDSILPKDLVVDYLMIDVETMDRQVLQGVKEIVKRSPNIIIHTQFIGIDNIEGERQRIVPILDHFRSIGFKFYTYHYPPTIGNFSLGTFYERPYPQHGIQKDTLIMVPSTRKLVNGTGGQWSSV